MAFSVIFRVPGQMSRFRGHFPPVSRFCAPLCRAGNSMEEKLTAGSFSSEIFYQKCPCPRKCPNGHKSQICACFIGFCTKPPTKVREERTKNTAQKSTAAGQALGVLVGQDAAHGRHDGRRDDTTSPSLRCFFPKKRGPALGRTDFSMITKCQPFFNRNFDKNACFLSPHCLLYSYKNSGWFLCRSSAWAPPGRTEEAA